MAMAKQNQVLRRGLQRLRVALSWSWRIWSARTGGPVPRDHGQPIGCSRVLSVRMALVMILGYDSGMHGSRTVSHETRAHLVG